MNVTNVNRGTYDVDDLSLLPAFDHRDVAFPFLTRFLLLAVRVERYRRLYGSFLLHRRGIARTRCRVNREDFLGFGFLHGCYGIGELRKRGMREREKARLLVFEESYFAAGHVETLLFGLRKVLPFVYGEFGIVDERVVSIVVLCCSVPLCYGSSVV
jgi:hypothetical protein